MTIIAEHNPLSCVICHKLFRHTEEIVTISARVFDKENFTFTPLLKPFYTSGFGLSVEQLSEVTPRERNFHLTCFEEVAGKDFLP